MSRLYRHCTPFLGIIAGTVTIVMVVRVVHDDAGR